MQCSRCETTNPEDNLFCEGCGTRMGDSAPAAATADLCVCGVPLSEMDADGFCSGCGRRLKRPPEDHIEIELLPGFAGVSDRGLRHSRNEDRFALVRSGNSYALIVCDGVSMSPDADQASSTAVQSAAEVFTKGLAEADFVAVDLLRESVRQAARWARRNSNHSRSFLVEFSRRAGSWCGRGKISQCSCSHALGRRRRSGSGTRDRSAQFDSRRNAPSLFRRFVELRAWRPRHSCPRYAAQHAGRQRADTFARVS